MYVLYGLQIVGFFSNGLPIFMLNTLITCFPSILDYVPLHMKSSHITLLKIPTNYFITYGTTTIHVLSVFKFVFDKV